MSGGVCVSGGGVCVCVCVCRYVWVFLTHLPFWLQALREEVEEKFNEGTFSWEERRPHDCSALLKQFLRSVNAAITVV